MSDKYIPLDDRPEKKIIRFLMVIFGLLCLFTSSWWALYLARFPENDNVFWIATFFLFIFGIYQIYAGLGYARRYIDIKGETVTIRQSSISRARSFSASSIEKLEVRTMDMVLRLKDGGRYRVKLGLKYPDLGQNIRESIIEYANSNNIEVFYKNEEL